MSGGKREVTRGAEVKVSEAWSSPSERNLLERFQRGEESAFEELFGKYREAVYAVAYKVLRDQESALDVVQDAFLRVFRKADTFRGESGFYAWVRRIALNLAIDKVRARRPENTPLEEETLAQEKHGSGAARMAGENPADEVAGGELAEALEREMAGLGEEHRMVLVLHAQEGLSYREIAEQMDCPLGTVMSRLHYARQTLAGKLRRYLEDED